MGARQREWARKTRDKIFETLGRVCAACGETEGNMEFDCIKPMGPHHSKQMEWSWRMSFYRQQLREGNLQILCERCNGTKRATEGTQLEALPSGQPF